MKWSTLASRLTLRAKLLFLNAIVAVALAELSLQAWHASAMQEHAQARQVELVETLQLTQQLNMLHGALRADAMAALLVGQAGSLAPEDVLRHAQANARDLMDTLKTLAQSPQGPELSAKLERTRSLAQAYRQESVALIELASRGRGPALAGWSALDLRFHEAEDHLDEQAQWIRAALKQAQAEAAREADAARRGLLMACMLTLALTSGFVALITATIRRRLRDIGAVAQAIAGGDLKGRVDARAGGELGELGQAINQMAGSLSAMIDTMRGDAQRVSFGSELAEALDMADREQHVNEVAARAMAGISPEHPMELLVSDSSRAQMERAAEHPRAGAPGCSVGSPYDCVAVRRGNAVRFDNSESLSACRHLRGRACGPVSAVCVPVTFMGRAIGVLHAAGPVEVPLAEHQAQHLGTLGTQIGARIGTVRTFEKTQVQAATDSLTGLPNRRTLEARMRTLAGGGQTFAVVMCDLDHFKLLNDTHGHAAGDNALRLFADVLRHSLRESDSAGRWGGEEFAFVLQGADARAADEMVQRVRRQLASALQMGKSPVFTASFGIADTSMARRPEQLVQMADVALYQAKGSGRDRACIADPSLGLEPALVRRNEPGPGVDVDAALQEEA